MTETASSRRVIRLGTRASALALWQAEHVRARLLDHWRVHAPERALTIELVKITTIGDRILDRPLNQVGGKGLFVKGIEEELLGDRIDLAVHSMKDMPAKLPPGLVIACTPERADPRDALISRTGAGLDQLPAGSRLGTSSLRRAALARRIAPELEIVSIRGNVPTRIAKIEEGSVDAVLLAAAGLHRLGLDAQISEHLDVERFCPAACQGILALEIREQDSELAELLAPLQHGPTAVAAAAERSFLATLEGGCQVPMACHARFESDDRIAVRGLVVDPGGEPLLETREHGAPAQADALGRAVAETLLSRGAREIIDALGHP
ncbi:hydroxymethylbilane synthase [Pseudenhygromyxa sp. WMMC2535]|uniref:hydroxymethylbilane synthase n=1 Tax=Pseudenhygromyxa sp. WMMC2535 TaxID=2712867 RepID=UPI0031FA1F55